MLRVLLSCYAHCSSMAFWTLAGGKKRSKKQQQNTSTCCFEAIDGENCEKKLVEGPEKFFAIQNYPENIYSCQPSKPALSTTTTKIFDEQQQEIIVEQQKENNNDIKQQNVNDSLSNLDSTKKHKKSKKPVPGIRNGSSGLNVVVGNLKRKKMHKNSSTNQLDKGDESLEISSVKSAPAQVVIQIESNSPTDPRSDQPIATNLLAKSNPAQKSFKQERTIPNQQQQRRSTDSPKPMEKATPHRRNSPAQSSLTLSTTPTLPVSEPQQIPRNDSLNGIKKNSSTCYVENAILVGRIQIHSQYSSQKKLLILTVGEAQLNLLDSTKNTSATDSPNLNEVSTQVRLTHLAEKNVKFRTKFREGNKPIFNETFVFNILPDELLDTVIRIRVYKKCRTTSLLLADAFFKARLVDPNKGASTCHWLKLRTPQLLLHKMSLLPQILHSKNSNTTATSPTASYSAPSSASSSRRQTQQSLALTIPTSSSGTGYVPPPMEYGTGNGTPPFGGAGGPGISVSRRSSTVDDCGRFCALPQSDGTPELLISLCYLEEQSKVVVGIDKGIGFIQHATSSNSTPSSLATASSTNGGGTLMNSILGTGSALSKPPDTFVRVSVLSPNVTELMKQKSETIKANSAPHFNHTAVFQIARAEIDTVLILVQVFAVGGGLLRRKTLMGWLCLGGGEGKAQLGPSTPDAQQHWHNMICGIGTTVEMWHNLMKPSDWVPFTKTDSETTTKAQKKS